MAGASFILVETLPFTLLYLLLALIPLYTALYCVGSRAPSLYTFLSTSAAVIAFAWCPYAAPTQCPQADIILRLACGTAIMKVLDMFFRRHQPPKLNRHASPAVYAFHLLIELRYESFDISTARKSALNFSDNTEYAIHLATFLFLQCLPQSPVVKAFGILLAIWLIWNFMHYILKYRDSPPLFGPIYRAENLSYFWTQTWHNAYTSPTRTLGYRPMRKVFGPIGGVMGGFGLMAIFHVWALAPYVEPDGLFRVAVFFIANGAGSVADYWLWEKRNTWTRILVNWAFEVFLAQYTAAKFDIPDGLMAIDYKNICRVQS
jgi:Membrane bound O-acyl transferase family